LILLIKGYYLIEIREKSGNSKLLTKKTNKKKQKRKKEKKKTKKHISLLLSNTLQFVCRSTSTSDDKHFSTQ
jgi:hypothetical protein